MVCSSVAINGVEVRLAAPIILADGEVRCLEQLTVLVARDVRGLGFVPERQQLADDEQRYSKCCCGLWSSLHDSTLA